MTVQGEDGQLKSPYHHGDLKQALLSEAERIVETEGLAALSLREAARRVGVSHTAPRNHFGDMTGLLSELAAHGYWRFAVALSAGADAAGSAPAQRLRGMGRAYIRFAKEHPGLFTLMFRFDRLDQDRPALQEAIAAARQAVADAIAARTGDGMSASPLTRAARLAAVRSLVHGYAVLLLDNRLKGLLALADTDADTLFDAMMDSLSFAGVDRRDPG